MNGQAQRVEGGKKALNLTVKPVVKGWLEVEARKRDRSVAWLVGELVEREIARRGEDLKEIMEGMGDGGGDSLS